MQFKDREKEDKKSLLKYYLGEFAVYFNDDEQKLFEDKLKNLMSCVIRADNFKLLKKAICYILLNMNKSVRYLYIKSNDLLDTMLSDEVDSEKFNFDEIQNYPMLIIYHPRVAKKNKIMWETLNYLTETRKGMGKPTIIISDAPRLFDEHGTLVVDNVINLSTFISNTPATGFMAKFEGSSSVGSIYND